MGHDVMILLGWFEFMDVINDDAGVFVWKMLKDKVKIMDRG